MFTQLEDLYPTHACREFNRVFPLLKENCYYNAENIPQLQDISDFLHREYVRYMLETAVEARDNFTKGNFNFSGGNGEGRG